MKVLDPGSVVRESEFATAANSAGVPDRIRAQYNKVLRGERLAHNTRADFVDRAEKLFNSQLELQRKLEEETRETAAIFGLDPNVVAPDLSGGLGEESVVNNDPLGIR